MRATFVGPCIWIQIWVTGQSQHHKLSRELYASTGLRREEILSLIPEYIDFQKRMIMPNDHEGETKKSWVSFYNEEAEIAVKECVASKKPSRGQRLFPMQRDEVVGVWKAARDKTGMDITRQKLRQ